LSLLNNLKMKKSVVGVIGLGTMGSNLLLNISDHKLAGAGFDIDQKKVDLLLKNKRDNISATNELKTFVSFLEKPAKIILLVPAGPIVDSVLKDLIPLLSAGDVVIDGGNSYFKDTDRRFHTLKETGLHFMGMGVSGGEEGARFGPSIMPGGDESAYHSIESVLNAIAAIYKGEPCAAYMGNGPAGHYVKMVHNGIEYAMLQIIAETYSVLKKINKLDNVQIANIFKSWVKGELNGYLMESAIEVILRKDDLAEGFLIDHVLDVARSKGTGKWTSQDAMEVQVPVPSIDMAVAVRDLSSWIDLRKQLASRKTNELPAKKLKTTELKKAVSAAFMLCYAQGLHQIHKASEVYKFDTSLLQVVKNWRAGCIIRSGMLPVFKKAYEKNPSLVNILADEEIFKSIYVNIPSLSSIVLRTIQSGYTIPAIESCLSYFRMMTSDSLPMNVIQGLRDHFGAHTYERNDRTGIFHTDWAQPVK